MKNEKLLAQIEATEKELEKMKAQLNEPQPDIEGATKWLKELTEKEFKVLHEDGNITYYIDGKPRYNWTFKQDLKYGYFYYGYYQIYIVLKDQYRLDYPQMQPLIKEVVQAAFNCKELTTKSFFYNKSDVVQAAFNCKELTTRCLNVIL